MLIEINRCESKASKPPSFGRFHHGLVKFSDGLWPLGGQGELEVGRCRVLRTAWENVGGEFDLIAKRSPRYEDGQFEYFYG